MVQKGYRKGTEVGTGSRGTGGVQRWVHRKVQRWYRHRGKEVVQEGYRKETEVVHRGVQKGYRKSTEVVQGEGYRGTEVVQ